MVKEEFKKSQVVELSKDIKTVEFNDIEILSADELLKDTKIEEFNDIEILSADELLKDIKTVEFKKKIG